MEDRRRARPPARFSTGALHLAGFYSAEARKRGVHDRLGRAGGRRGLLTDEVAARGVMGTHGVVANRFSLKTAETAVPPSFALQSLILV